ncbi:type II toxin-antitoxin system VapB family antitoxin [Sphingomonas sp. 37zxx]|uniref:type II toxin-antitoxin system VapB family antitoxin n=1 Tax=Sphingomonas sp. 37zxx TaxID=1550073 RepID=UPI00053BEEDD|nr:type II toxin-antitoxin system VapB family antitoxin [Sphingomonas sp. 37zxx]
MRTNVEIDDELMAKAMAASEATTKREVIDEALRTYVRLKNQRSLLALKGTVKWEGDLDEMRQNRDLR